jgi:hypothetical protein
VCSSDLGTGFGCGDPLLRRPVRWTNVRNRAGDQSIASPCLARIIRERCAFAIMRRRHWFVKAAGFDTALRAVLKTSPGVVLSEGPEIGPESEPERRVVRDVHE